MKPRPIGVEALEGGSDARLVGLDVLAGSLFRRKAMTASSRSPGERTSDWFSRFTRKPLEA